MSEIRRVNTGDAPRNVYHAGDAPRTVNAGRTVKTGSALNQDEYEAARRRAQQLAANNTRRTRSFNRVQQTDVDRYRAAQQKEQEARAAAAQQQAQGGESGRVSNHIVEQIQTYIAEHYAEKLTLTGIASQFYISPYYLSRLFKKSINLSLIEYINGVRIKAAQNLIEKTNESISDISEKTGFLTTAHFRRVFKDATGLSPQQYRQYYKRLSK